MINIKNIYLLLPAVFAAGSVFSQVELELPSDPNNPNAMKFNYLPEYKALPGYPVEERLKSFKKITLTTDLSSLKEGEKKALVYLIEAAKHADNIFWMQAYGVKDSVLSRVKDETLKQFISLNYGPWDRLNDDKPFVEGVGAKPAGARFYPEGMTKEELDQQYGGMQTDPYAVIVRNPMNMLEMRPYFIAYDIEIAEIIQNLMKASEALHDVDPELEQFLRMRAEALAMNNYDPSDIAWLGLKNSNLDIIIGPIETYEDKLLGQKPSFEAYVLVRDKAWGEKLSKYIGFLPELQKGLPVEAEYKKDGVGNGNSQLAVFDAIYYAGDCNSGSKTIAVNLPNSEMIQEKFGTRRSQLKNVMKAKFDNMVQPITGLVIDPSQRALVNFDAFFNNVMFHEVAHGLGIKNTISGKGTVKDALGATYSAIEECKADVLGLYMVTKLVEKGELPAKLDNYYVTFVASVFRSVRFGASSAHGRANMIQFNRLVADGAVVRSSAGTYSVDVVKMKASIEKLAGDLLRLQGNGDMAAAEAFLTNNANIGKNLKDDLNVINKAGIPVDLIFEQGTEVLGLK